MAASRGVDLHKSVEDFVLGTLSVLPPEISFYTQFLTGLRQHEIYPEHKVSLTKEWTPTPWNEAWYKGVLDLKLISERNDESQPLAAIVYDWKSGKIYPDHDDQKSLYSLATFSEHPTVLSVRAMHVYLDLGQTREKAYHRDQVPELRKQWETRVAILEGTPPLDMIPNPGYYCRWCSFSRGNGGPCRF